MYLNWTQVVIIVAIFTVILASIMLTVYGYKKGLRIINLLSRIDKELLIQELNDLERKSAGKILTNFQIQHHRARPVDKKNLLEKVQREQRGGTLLPIAKTTKSFEKEPTKLNKLLESTLLKRALAKSILPRKPKDKKSVLEGRLSWIEQELSQIKTHQPAKILANFRHKPTRMPPQRKTAKPELAIPIQQKKQPELPLDKVSSLIGVTKPNELLEKELQEVNRSLSGVYQPPKQRSYILTHLPAKIKEKPTEKPLPVFNSSAVPKKEVERNKKTNRELADIDQEIARLGK